MNALRFTRFAAALVVALSVTAAHAQAIDWVTVGDPGNAADTTGDPNPAGAVAASFRIMKYEFTNQLYTDFLNSVATVSDPYSLYNNSMGSDASGGISQGGSFGAYNYSVKTNMGDKPVNYVSWFDAARVSNWLMNGATSSSSTETGAYTLVGGQTSGTAPAVNPGATFYIPTENQWYKAAYYKGSGTNAGYWQYATQSDTAPTAVSATTVGTGTSGGVSPVISGNFANYNQAADWNGQDYGNVTTVGTNGGPSAYGAFDMSGNVFEWNDLTGAAGARGLRGGYWGYYGAFDMSGNVFEWNDLTGAAGSSRVFRGGDYYYGNAVNLSSAYRDAGIDPARESFAIGFRLASPASGPSGVPEIDPAGIGSVLGVVCGALGLLERRRVKAA